MPFWGCMGTGKSTGIGPYMTGVSKNEMLSCMKLPTTNVFIQNKPAHNIDSVAPLTIDLPTGVLGASTAALLMLGTTIALLSFTVVASGGTVIRGLGLALPNLWYALGMYLKMDQKRVWVLAA